MTKHPSAKPSISCEFRPGFPERDSTLTFAYHHCTEVAEQLESDGVAVHFDVRKGMGHVPPPDLAHLIRNGLDWIMAQSG